MASDRDFVEYVVDQVDEAGIIAYRKMFGEYALYCDGKVVALVCDNSVFVKQTEGGRRFIGEVVEAPAYPGAKMSFLIEEKLDDREWMSELIKITCGELPEPRPKRKKARPGKS